jgi:hypothetical protein
LVPEDLAWRRTPRRSQPQWEKLIVDCNNQELRVSKPKHMAGKLL